MTEPANVALVPIPPELIELKRRFIARLPSHLDAVMELFRSLSDGRWNLTAAESLHRMVHSLTGTSGTFGLTEVTVTARRVEALLHSMVLKAGAPPNPEWAELAAAMEQLNTQRTPLAGQWPSATTPMTTTGKPPALPMSALVHMVVDLQSPYERLESSLSIDGFRVQVFTNPEAFRTNLDDLSTEVPAAVVLDVEGLNDANTVTDRIQRLGLKAHPNISLLVGLKQRELSTRLAVSRAGASRCMPQPLNSANVIEALRAATGRQPEQPWRVLLVDDDAWILAAHATHLRQAGMEVRTLSDPMQAQGLLDSFEPDVLLLDVYMPEVNGPELAAVLRECDNQQHLAIIFLSGETDMTQQLLALDLGGDDFLIKPVQPAHLVAAVTARARRARQNGSTQQRLEKTLYEREREHLALNEHAIVSMTNAAGHITYANDLFCTESGYRREDALGKTHSILKSDLHPPSFFDDLWATISSGHVWQGEICNKRRDGSLFWVECSITPFLDVNGRPYQYVAIRTNISHIKAAEETLRRQRDMQRMVSETAARIMAAPSHLATQEITAALRASGELLEADQAFLFRFTNGGASMRNTHFWSAPGTTFNTTGLDKLALQQFTWIGELFLREGMVVIPDATELPPQAGPERAMFTTLRASAMIAFPIMKNGQISGLLGYSAHRTRKHWGSMVSELLSVLSEIIGSALARQRAESALRESQSRLSFLVSSSPVTIYKRSMEVPHPLTYVSPNTAQLMGIDSDAFLSDASFWREQVHHDDLAHIDIANAMLQDGAVRQREYRMRHGNGQYRWVQDQVRVACDEATGLTELVGYWTDITERKEIEEALFRLNQELEQRVKTQTQSIIESERFARATLNALDAKVAILNSQGEILTVNRAWRLTEAGDELDATLYEGVNYLETCDELCGVALGNSRPLAEGARAVVDGRQTDFLYEYACPESVAPCWYVCRIKRFPGDGPVRLVVSHEDITAMKQIERQQMRSQRLESLGTLAGGVAHDLNNSLAPILMGMGILQDQYPEEQKLISMINNSAKRGADMVRQLLAFAKGVDGKRIALQPALLVRELESLMKGSFPKNIEVQVEDIPPLPLVLGDSTQLHQILLNLCVNARDAMPHGGTLTVIAKTVEIDAAYARALSDGKPGQYVSLRVTDTGSGIPPDILDRIFDPFFTTKTQDKGTGLGLSSVLGIVKGHGGFVQVYSTVGKGTSFVVYLPVSQATPNLADASSPAKPFRGQGETVLFVDDEAALRAVGHAVLERLNFQPIVAMDGEDGLIKATENRATLKAIITDMHMPHMDGLAFVHAVRRTLPDIPIILASGRVDDQIASDFRDLGVTLRLDKPFTESQLSEMLRSIFEPQPEKP